MDVKDEVYFLHMATTELNSFNFKNSQFWLKEGLKKYPLDKFLRESLAIFFISTDELDKCLPLIENLKFHGHIKKLQVVMANIFWEYTTGETLTDAEKIINTLVEKKSSQIGSFTKQKIDPVVIYASIKLILTLYRNQKKQKKSAQHYYLYIPKRIES